MLNTNYSPWPSFTEEEANAVKDVLLSNRVNAWTGTTCRQFEEAFAEWAGVSHAIAVMNGTVALELALKGLGIGPGDEVIVSPRSFIASVSCVISAGATPVFADIDPNTQNITTDTIKPMLSDKTRAIICVHLAGWPCEMDDIMALANEYSCFVIEDCAQAHGARYRKQSVGAIGHVAAWSFCQDKIMTTGGEGGMVTTNDKALWSKMWSYKDHGKSWDAVFNAPKTKGFKWLHEQFGTNLRMTEMQAAIGLIQLKRMPMWHEKRLANAEKIWEAARKLPGLHVPNVPSHLEHAAYKAYVFLKLSALSDGWNRERILDTMQEKGVPCYTGSCSEIYREKAFDDTGIRPEKALPHAHELGETSLMLLTHPTLTDDEMHHTCQVLQEVMILATKKTVSEQLLPV
ncbi:MAG: DegT/DnrJ/EryC1/StrS aminotransferase family protein [Legionellaceae bacterium]|nr:DegT/DnrJ/EryC1/StrS aminotransferase family protein [Legionellaceae bacterium]